MTMSIIIPATARTLEWWYMCAVALRTCRVSEPNSEIVLLLNNTDPSSPHYDDLMKLCAHFNIRFHYVDGRFNMSKSFNIGTRLSTGDVIAYCNQDLIFYPKWMTNICEQWNRSPDYYALTSYSIGWNGYPCQFEREHCTNEIIPCHNPGSGLIVIQRKSNHIWDEAFPFWEQDADFMFYMQRHGLKSGICTGSRVDHMWHGVYPKASHDMIEDDSQSTVLLRKKWNLDLKTGIPL